MMCERNIDQSVASSRDHAHNLGMCPDRESNWRPLGSQACTQFTEIQQPKQPYRLFLQKRQ